MRAPVTGAIATGVKCTALGRERCPLHQHDAKAGANAHHQADQEGESDQIARFQEVILCPAIYLRPAHLGFEDVQVLAPKAMLGSQIG
jgi:hypothetical protein